MTSDAQWKTHFTDFSKWFITLFQWRWGKQTLSYIVSMSVNWYSHHGGQFPFILLDPGEVTLENLSTRYTCCYDFNESPPKLRCCQYGCIKRWGPLRGDQAMKVPPLWMELGAIIKVFGRGSCFSLALCLLPFEAWKVGPHQMLVPWPCTYQPWELWEINSCSFLIT